MTAVKQFIDDAIKGGWGGANDWRPEIKSYFDFIGFYGQAGYHQLLLDPLAWQAVSKTRGWDLKSKYVCSVCGNGLGRDSDEPFQDGWTHHWHIFIDLLADGLSIEEALGKLT